ncbi:3-hydroxyacyl-ACP dehydratase [Solitalea longa]|uniref:3-hydroxyacyl-ACP dehydratase n=1 Tax=Solitalea longa TaxID=2079460 RepID=A0A2S5A1R1_9SPHI|nr:3-hydroxyacyl-ACP dehydratase [Solitalea longa]POY36540.1 3-hydroxyacyl-ACP dehydratase [Solitalea longa]
MSNNADIISLIPQRAPFVMVDELLLTDEKCSRTKFSINAENLFVENGKFTEPGLVENIAQTAAARVGYIANQLQQAVPVGFIGAVKNLEVFSLPNVNETIETEIAIENEVFNVTVISGKVWCNDALLAQCEMKIVINQS